MIPWEIFDVTTTAVSPSAGSAMATTTAVTAQMRETAVSVLLHILKLSHVSSRVTKFDFALYLAFF